MKQDRKKSSRSEDGIALLIAIFVLLLVSVVAIALLVSSGTETALGANYRSSSTVYYGALAGLEEARGRLLTTNPNYFGSSAIPTPMPLGQAVYVLNRLPSEDITPWDSSNPYYDTEYQSEFGVAPPSQPPLYSVWDNNIQGIPGPAFKWVRINAVSDASLHTEINYSAGYHPGTAVYYDPANVDNNGNAWPSMVVGPTTTAKQVLEITSLAALPNGSKKILQYLVTPTGQSLNFPAALTLDGPNVGVDPTMFWLPYGGQFYIDGSDTTSYSNGSGCVAGPNPTPNPVRAIGYANNDSSGTNITTVIGDNHGEYTGVGFTSTTPSVFYVGNPPPTEPLTLAGNMQTVPEIDALAASISQEADVTLTGPVTQSDSSNLMPTGMSATNPMTIVVNGDFTENGWSGTGYGTLLVTGTFTYDQNSSWNGVILVIGKGVFRAVDSLQRNGQINGAVLIASTVDSLGNPLASFGSPTFDFNYEGHTQGNYGIYYSSCWVQVAQTKSRYKVLSFHEIPQS